MAGTRLPLEVIEGRGRKHLSLTERAERGASQIRNKDPVKRLTPPKWLPKSHHEEFRKISAALIKLMPDMIIREDGDTIATYCIARAEWVAATNRVNAALAAGDLAACGSWSKVQARFLATARACANDLGMTVTSRCRLVLPESSKPKEENAFEKLMKERQQRRA